MTPKNRIKFLGELVVIFSFSRRQKEKRKKKRKKKNKQGARTLQRNKLLSEWCYIWVWLGISIMVFFYHSDCVIHLNDVSTPAAWKNTVILCLELLSFINCSKTETGLWEGHFQRLSLKLPTTEKSETFSNFLWSKVQKRATPVSYLCKKRKKNSLYNVLSNQLVCFRFPGGYLKDSTHFFFYIMK